MYKSNNMFFSLAIFVFGIFAMLLPQQSSAVPAFARQTGMACASCHFQSFPALNAFGRTFRAQGYTMRGTQNLIEGNDLSMPSSLNASVITKIRYQRKGNVDGNRGEVQWPDEAALLVGGRASEHVGFLMELGMGPDEGTGTADLVTGDVTVNNNGNFLSTKFHFNVTDNFAIIPFSTDGLGVGYGYELLNTGAQRSQRPIENRKGFSSGQLTGTASGEATGIAFAYSQHDLFVNYSHWTPTWSNTNANIFGGLAHYLRFAYMPAIGGWDTGFGVSAMSGTVKTGATDPSTDHHVESWTIDAQAQGEISGMPFGIYASYGVVPKSSATKTNQYNSSTTNDESAYGLVGKLGIVPGKTQVYLGYASLDTGTSTETTTIGVQQLIAQNIKLELYNVSSNSSNSGDDYTMLMLFVGL